MPIYATVFGALLCTILAMFFNLGSLINLLSLTQLVACIFVAISVVTVRYKPNQLLLRYAFQRYAKFSHKSLQLFFVKCSLKKKYASYTRIFFF